MEKIQLPKPQSNVSPHADLSTDVCPLPSLKSEEKGYIKLTAHELESLKLILYTNNDASDYEGKGGYGVPVIGWLRKNIKYNIRRRSLILGYLVDAGVAEDWCEYVSNDDSWSTYAHSAWHKFKRSKDDNGA